MNVTYPMGECQFHGQRTDVDGVPVCISCQELTAKARRGSGLVNTQADPGHEGMKNLKLALPTVDAEAEAAPRRRAEAPVVPTITSGVEALLSILSKMPMPTDIKQFKTLAKIREQLEKLLKEQAAN